jgi:hypothetical protein
MSYEGPEATRRNRLDKSPKHKEKRRECRRCRCRTVHVYDHGLNSFICSDCELGNDNELKGGRRR